GKTYDPPVNPNAKLTVFLDDSEDEADKVKKEAEPLPKKPNHADPSPLKAYKLKIPKMEQISAAFFTEECSAILQNKLLLKLGDPRSLLIPYKLANLIEYLTLADLGICINLMPYSLYATLSGTTLKPIRMSIRLENHTYQYPMGVAENMLVQVGTFMFLVDFVILQMEEDDRVPLILGRPFLYTADAIIRVKNKELNLGIRKDRATFLIDKAMQHSHLNDDTRLD
ncbi:reverse transcriptase domain-containing protein, partial [Tanacetum coccineum]